MWEVEWGESLPALRKQYSQTGEIPPALARRPNLPEYLQFYKHAFIKLSRFRTYGMSANPIDYMTILLDGRMRYGFEGDDLLMYIDLVSECDQAFLSATRKKAELKAQQLKEQRKQNA